MKLSTRPINGNCKDWSCSLGRAHSEINSFFHSLLRQMRQRKSKKIQVHNRNIQRHRTVKQTAREHDRNIHRKTEKSKITAQVIKLTKLDQTALLTSILLECPLQEKCDTQMTVFGLHFDAKHTRLSLNSHCVA